MKSKKKLVTILILILLVIGIGLLSIGSRVLPTVNHAIRISELLQPMLEAKNQAMHISVLAEINGETVAVESDIFLVTEDNIRYLVLDQNGNSIYISDNVLLLENGRAFRIGDNMQVQVASYADLLPQIKTLFEVLAITAEETENQINYKITVTGEQVDMLLAAASLGEALPVDGIQKLNLQLTEKNEKLDHIAFSGNGNLNGTAVQLHVTLSGFRVLAIGDYPIPEAVKQSAATVNPEELFSLTEDLYRLVLALAPFADMDTVDGTLDLTVDCGQLQLDSRMDLSDLKTTSNSQLDPEKLQALPEMLGWLCMEGQISCTHNDDAYVYTLALDQAPMKELSRMILPELAQYGGDLTEGSISIILEAGKITSMNVSIKGKISAWIAQIPVTVGAEFTFD